MNNSRSAARPEMQAILLISILFFLNVASHDLFCNDDIHGVCVPLHCSSPVIGPELDTMTPDRIQIPDRLSHPNPGEVFSGFARIMDRPPSF